MQNRYTIFFLLSLLLASLSAQQSQNMTLHGSWDDNSLPNRSGVYYNDIWGYHAKGREYAILGSVVGTIFMDVTNPNVPVEVDRIDGGYQLSLWRDFKTYDTYAYGVADETSSSNRSGLQIFDLENLPNSVNLVYDSFAFFETAHNIFIDTNSGRLYVVGSNTRRNGIIVLDISVDPTSPTLLASINLPGGYVHDVYVRNDTAYCSHGWNGLYIYDMRFPTSPVTLGSITNYPNQGYNHSSWLSDDGNVLVFADESHNRHLKVLDVSNLNNLNIIGTIKSTMLAPNVTNSIAHNPFFRGDSLYISYYHEGVQIYDMSNPRTPVNVSYYDTEPNNINYNGYDGCWGVYPFLPSGNIIASDVENGLFVMESTAPVLAVGRLHLQAEQLGNQVQLHWQDDELSAFTEFEIERKQGESFELMGWEEMSTPGASYQWIDEKPLFGENIYRIVAIDGAGNRQYSQEVQLTVVYESNKIELFPKPAYAASGLNIRLDRKREGFVQLKLMALNGQVLQQTQLSLEAGYNLHQLDISQLSAGSYILLIQDEEMQYVERIGIR